MDTCRGVWVELHLFSTQPRDYFSGHMSGSGGRAPPILKAAMIKSSVNTFKVVEVELHPFSNQLCDKKFSKRNLGIRCRDPPILNPAT